MTPFPKTVAFAILVFCSLFLIPKTGMGAKADSKIVVRIETAKATRKGGRIVIQVTGMGRTAAVVRGGGQLLRRGQKHEPNKDGLLEYDLYYVPPRGYSGDKLKPVKASLVESNVPPGAKGVRIYGEFNEKDVMFPESKVRERAPKKETFLAGEGQPSARKKESAVTEESPKPKKEETAPRTEVQEKKSRGWNLNPFHRKPAPTPQPTPVLARVKKPEPALKREEITRVKKEPPPAAHEEPKRKRGLFSWNPFHREAAPVTRPEVAVPESKKPEPARKKEEVARRPGPKIQESTPPMETPVPKAKKKRRGWNLNPFHRKTAEPEANPVQPLPKRPEPTPKREATAPRKPEAAPKKEEAPPKKEEAKKKKKKWGDLNPLNWNPFKRKAGDATR